MFCVICKRRVLPLDLARDRAQAAAAAAADGFVLTPHAERVVTPGSLSANARRALTCDWYVRHNKWLPGITVLGERTRLWSAVVPELERLGLLENGHLTPMGERIADLCGDSRPPAGLKTDLTYAPKPRKAKAKKSPTKPTDEPSLPMICTCGHGVLSHVSKGKDNKGKDALCRDCPIGGCKQYVQAKPKKPKKDRKHAAPTEPT